jgi:hypothetical protein
MNGLLAPLPGGTRHFSSAVLGAQPWRGRWSGKNAFEEKRSVLY